MIAAYDRHSARPDDGHGAAGGSRSGGLFRAVCRRFGRPLRRALLLAACCTPFAAAAQVQTSPRTAAKANDTQQIGKLIQVLRFLGNYYVDEVDTAPLTERAIRAMLEELDPHSAYLGVEEMNSARESFEGGFSGIGIEYNVLRDTLIVVNTIAGGPAERAGLQPNDRIVRIDSLDAVGMRRSDIPRHLRGKSGTAVAIDVVRHGSPAKLHFVIVRDKIPLNTVDAAYTTDGGIGYIKVNRFGRTTMQEFRSAYERLGNPDRLILDLRGNGGGLLEQAIEMAEFFLPQGSLIVSTEGRAVPPQSFHAQRDGAALDGKLVVLLDETSASASEIVAGAVQDWDRGVIVGRTSFGKGLVQRQVPLGDGSAVRITIARYHTPSGRVIQRPYQRGKRREYYLDHLRRYDDATRDSLDAAAPEFRTLRTGRIVRGGGGIHPDVAIKADTSNFSDYQAQLIRRGVVNEYVATVMDRLRDSLARRYPDLDRFAAGFSPDDRLLRGLVELGGMRGVKPDSAALLRSAPLMRTQLKALVAQRLFGVEGFYRIMNAEYSEAFRQAVDILSEWRKKGAPLLKKEN